ncbi:MAG: hypothetical protein ACE5JL_05525 [Dehalococcoidia bacterium]
MAYEVCVSSLQPGVIAVLLEGRVRESFSLTMADHLPEKMEVERDKRLAEQFTYYTRQIMNDLATHGLLDFGHAMNIGLASLRLAGLFPASACDLIHAMGDAAHKLKSRSDFDSNRDLQATYNELVRRIRQQRGAGRGDGRESVITKVKETLKRLGEPDVERRHS